MIWIDRIALFSTLDFAALTLIVAGWIWIGWRIENPAAGKPSVSYLMADFRRDWMVQMVTRQPRMFDAQLISGLRQGTTFFASASMIAMGGGLALIGNTEQLAGVAPRGAGGGSVDHRRAQFQPGYALHLFRAGLGCVAGRGDPADPGHADHFGGALPARIRIAVPQRAVAHSARDAGTGCGQHIFVIPHPAATGL